MTLNFNFDYTVELPDCKIQNIIAVFKKLVLLILADFTMKVLKEFATKYMNEPVKPFKCKGCGNNIDFIWKTKWAKDTTITTIYGDIKLGQMQVKCKKCGKKRFITRELLGIAPRKRIPKATKQILALIGSLTSFRVSEKIMSLMGAKVDKMAVWRCVQRVGEKVTFGLDSGGLPISASRWNRCAYSGYKETWKRVESFCAKES